MRTLAFLLALMAATVAGAVDPSEMLSDPVIEARAREIGKELRCLVCQNQSIDESEASLARDLRRLVRERLKAGDTDAQVIDYVVSRYGDFVLLRPPFKAVTWGLWLGPGAILAVGIFSVFVFFRRRRVVETAPLSEDERRRIAALLTEDRR